MIIHSRNHNDIHENTTTGADGAQGCGGECGSIPRWEGGQRELVSVQGMESVVGMIGVQDMEVLRVFREGLDVSSCLLSLSSLSRLLSLSCLSYLSCHPYA